MSAHRSNAGGYCATPGCGNLAGLFHTVEPACSCGECFRLVYVCDFCAIREVEEVAP